MGVGLGVLRSVGFAALIFVSVFVSLRPAAVVVAVAVGASVVVVIAVGVSLLDVAYRKHQFLSFHGL